MKLYVKNMVCNRCVMVVRNELEKLGFSPVSVELGEVELAVEISGADKQAINRSLQQFGFTVIDDAKSRMVEQVRTAIVELVYGKNNDLVTNLSDYLSEKLGRDYAYISHLFTQVEGTTIEQWYIAQKIERVKELLIYDELSLTEISYLLNYSSVAHLSRQFKKVTGLTPSHFRSVRDQRRRAIDEL